MSRLLLLLLPAAALLLFFPASPRLDGRVLDDAGSPIPGATVRVVATPHAALTGADGRFSLVPPRGRHRLTASREGFLIAAPGRDGVFRLEPLPSLDDDSYAWVEPTAGPGEGRCANCHGRIGREWLGSAHARAATNPKFRQLYDGSDGHGRQAGWSLLGEHPHGSRVCASCHAPTLPEDDPAHDDIRKISGVHARGVHCDFCHKVSGPGDGELGLSHGRYFLKLLRPSRGQLFFGPLDDVARGEDAYSSFQRDSRFCAACHEGTVFGVKVYSTYSEWRDSPAAREGKSCQSCHMRPTGDMHNVAPGRGGLDRDPWTLGNHAMFDGDHATMLRRCLDVRVAAVRDGSHTVVTVRLAAKDVGHRVPTGFIDKHLVLVVEADAGGKSVAHTVGETLDAAAGGLRGRAGRIFGRRLRDETGASPVPFWRAEAGPADTRLVPGRPEASVWRFASADAVRVRVVHRRFWAETSRAKGWPDADTVVADVRAAVR